MLNLKTGQQFKVDTSTVNLNLQPQPLSRRSALKGLAAILAASSAPALLGQTARGMMHRNLGGRLATGGGSKPIPYDRKVKCLVGNGSSYIDLGFPIGTGFWFSANVSLQVGGGSSRAFFGARQSNAYKDFMFVGYGYSSLFIRLGSSSEQMIINVNTAYVTEGPVSLSETGLVTLRDGTTTQLNVGEPSAYNIYLMALNQAGTPNVFMSSHERIYSLNIGNSEHELHLIPVVKDGKAYMFDELGGELLFGAAESSSDIDWEELP